MNAPMMRTTKWHEQCENPMMSCEKSRIVKQKQVNFLLMVNVHTRLDSPILKAHVTHLHATCV